MVHASEISAIRCGLGFRVVRRAQEPHRIVKLWVRLEDVERPALVTISVPLYCSVHVFDSTSTWMIPCSVALGRGWSNMKVVPSLSFLSWWSVIREGSRALGVSGRGRVTFPLSVPFRVMGFTCWVCPVIVEFYDSTLCSGEVVSNVFFPVQMFG